jgi:hypothetical protein
MTGHGVCHLFGEVTDRWLPGPRVWECDPCPEPETERPEVYRGRIPGESRQQWRKRLREEDKRAR